MNNSVKVEKSQFLTSSKAVLPKFCKTLEDTDYSKKKVNFFRYTFQDLLRDLNHETNHGLITAEIATHINDYIAKTLLQRNPNLSKHNAMDLLILSKKFINYMAMNRLINKKASQEILQNLLSKSELKKEHDNYFNSRLLPQIREIKGNLLYVGKKLEGCIDCNPEYKIFVDYFNRQSEGVLMSALIEVFEKIDSGNTFMSIIEFLVFNLRFKSFPEKIVQYLESSPEDEVYYKFLVLYCYFSRMERPLSLSFEDLILTLSLNLEKYNAFVEKFNRVISKRDKTC